MAWEQVIYPITSYIEQGTIVNFNCCENLYINRQGDNDNITFIANYITGGFTDSINLPSTETEIFRQGEYSITLRQDNLSGQGRGFQLRCKQDGQTVKLSFSRGGNASYKDFIKIGFAIDYANHKGALVIGSYSKGNYYALAGRLKSSIDESYTERNLYNWLIQAIPVSYTWQSVPAISGKNGSLSLPTLVDTDGEPISGQSASVFSSLPEWSNVRALINGAL